MKSLRLKEDTLCLVKFDKRSILHITDIAPNSKIYPYMFCGIGVNVDNYKVQPKRNLPVCKTCLRLREKQLKKCLACGASRLVGSKVAKIVRFGDN